MTEWNDESHDLLDDLIRRLEEAWRSGGEVDLAQFVPAADHPLRNSALVALIKVDQELRWKHDKGKTVAEYLAEWPELQSQTAQVAELQAAEDELRAEITTSRSASDGVADTQDFLPPPQPRAIHIRCPHCHNRVEIVEQAPAANVTCPQCGSHFTLADNETIDYENLPSPVLGRGAGGEGVRRIAHFELIELLGQGHFGSVYKARDTKLGRIVALKIPRRGQLLPEDVEDFLREARSAATLEHENIVPVYEAGEADGQVYIASRYIEGQTLDRWVAAQGRRLTPQEAARLSVVIAEAVHQAHQHGVIHRDLKPGNIMIDACGKPYIMDFGLAKRHSGEITMTVEGQILGTPAYMSPEQAKGQGYRADARSDVYSLGVILFELLTGERPFRGDLQMLLRQVAEDEAPSARKLNSRVSRDLETVCAKCLEKLPARRYETAASLADDLSHFLAGEPIHARPVSSPERFWRWCKRQPVVAGLLTTSVVLLVTIAIVGAAGYAQTSHALGLARTEESRAGKALRNEAAERARAEISLYFNRVELAYQEWHAGAEDYAETLLDACPPHLRGWEWGYVKQLCESRLRAFGSPSDWHECLAFSPDGARFAFLEPEDRPQLPPAPIRAARRGLRVWNLRTGQEIRTIQTSGSTVAFTSSSRCVAVRDYSGTLAIWDIDTGRLVNLYEHAGISDTVASRSGKFIATDCTGSISIWSGASGKRLTTLPWPEGNVRSTARYQLARQLYLSDRDDLVAAIHHDGVNLWEIATGNKLLGSMVVALEPFGSIRDVQLSADLRWIAFLEADTVTVKASRTGRDVLQVRDASIAAAFSPSAPHIAIAQKNDGGVWDIETGRKIMVLAGARGWLTFSPNGRQIAAEVAAGRARIWNAATGKEMLTAKGRAVVFNTHGTEIAVLLNDRTVKVYDGESARELRTFGADRADVQARTNTAEGVAVGAPEATVYGNTVLDYPSLVLRGHSDPVSIVQFSTDGKRIVSAGGWHNDGTVRVWDAATAQQLLVLRKYADGVEGMAISPDGRRIAYGGDEKVIGVWDTITGVQILTYRGHARGVRSLAFSPNGRFIVSGSDDAMRVWDAATGNDLLCSVNGMDDLRLVVFSPGGKRIASMERSQVVLWDAIMGKRLRTFGHMGDLYGAIAFAPDSRSIAMTRVESPVNELIAIYDVSTGKKVMSLRGAGRVSGIAFSPDGTRLVSVGKGITIWDVPTGREIMTLRTGPNAFRTVAFSTDGMRLASAGAGNDVAIWEAVPLGSQKAVLAPLHVGPVEDERNDDGAGDSDEEPPPRFPRSTFERKETKLVPPEPATTTYVPRFPTRP